MRWLRWAGLSAATILALVCAVRGYTRVSREEHEKAVSAYSLNSTLVRHGAKVYLLTSDNKKHTFPNRYTFNAYGQEWKHARPLDRAQINGIENGEEIPTLFDHHANEQMLALFTSQFLTKTENVFDELNLNYVYFSDYVVFTWRVTEQKFRLVAVPRPTKQTQTGDTPGMYKTDMKKFSEFAVRDYHVKEDVKEIEGEDPRLFVLNGRLWVVFCKRYPRQKPEIQVSFAELSILQAMNAGNAMAEVEIKFPVIDVDYKKEQPGSDQKNWSPFDWQDGSVLFVATIEPLRVVKVDTSVIGGSVGGGNDRKSVMVEGRTVSVSSADSSKRQTDNFPFGELRGGTPAVLVASSFGEGQSYLSFFHASNEPMEPPGGKPRYTDVLKTYSMGAYLFSPKPPYELQAMSRHPITHPSMYSGPWPNLPWAYYHMDYIVFPTNLVVVGGQDGGGEILLQYGHQDRETCVATLSLQGLLESLVPHQS